MSELYVGVDIGGTKIATAIVDAGGRILEMSTVPSQGRGRPVLDIIWDGIRQGVTLKGFDWERISAIGVGAPGPVDPQKGLWWGSTNLYVADPPIALAKEVRARSSCPTFIDNDVKAGGLGELHFGHGNSFQGPTDTFLFMSIGTGLASCMIVGGSVFRGNQFAGEIGHIPVDPGGHPCACGQRGCLETVAAGRALIRWGREALEAHWSPQLAELCGGDATELHGGHVLQAAKDGDRVAEALIRRLARGIAVAIVVGYRAYDPQLIVLGGGVIAGGGTYLLDRIKTELAELSPIYGSDKQVAVTGLHQHAGVLGAAAVAINARIGAVRAPTTSLKGGLMSHHGTETSS